MTRQVFCRKYKQELEGLDFAPFPGAKGQEFFDNVSKQAWQEWLKHQTTLINEKRLNVFEPDAKKFLEEQREKFFNNDESVEKAEGWTEENKKYSSIPVKKELFSALFLRDIYTSNKALQSIHTCLHDSFGDYSYIRKQKDKEIV
jgi:Fe-S cluster biosynthesis and repair protein YggX